MKRILVLIICTALLLSLCACTESEETETDFEFRLDKENDYYILTAYNGTDDDIEIPEEYNEKDVGAIDNNAFKGCTQLEFIEIPKTVERIDYQAFYDCKSLKRVIVDEKNRVYSGVGGCLLEIDTNTVLVGGSKSTIPNSATTIAAKAFSGREELKSIDIPDNILYIAKNAFENCINLTQINIGTGTIQIDSEAFINCSSLSEISLPNLVIIGDDVFDGCKSLKTIRCKSLSQPSGWDVGWLGNCKAEVIWGSDVGLRIDMIKTYYADIDIKGYGKITVKLDQSQAPITVDNFVSLAKSGFYDGLTFHRIIEGFMMQGGDPDGNGTGGSGKNIVGEFVANGHNNAISHTRGVISMARANDMNSASSQFFIMHADSLSLDGKYAAFGYVTEGMDVVDAVCESANPTDYNGTIPSADQPVINKITIREE